MSETVSQRVAANVRAEAARLKMSQRDLAAALGMSQSSTNRRWLGVTPFDVDQLYILADSFSIPVARLLPEEHERSQLSA